jgi:hypothetical protein
MRGERTMPEGKGYIGTNEGPAGSSTPGLTLLPRVLFDYFSIALSGAVLSPPSAASAAAACGSGPLSNISRYFSR